MKTKIIFLAALVLLLSGEAASARVRLREDAHSQDRKLTQQYLSFVVQIINSDFGSKVRSIFFNAPTSESEPPTMAPTPTSQSVLYEPEPSDSTTTTTTSMPSTVTTKAPKKKGDNKEELQRQAGTRSPVPTLFVSNFTDGSFPPAITPAPSDVQEEGKGKKDKTDDLTRSEPAPADVSSSSPAPVVLKGTTKKRDDDEELLGRTEQSGYPSVKTKAPKGSPKKDENGTVQSNEVSGPKMTTNTTVLTLSPTKTSGKERGSSVTDPFGAPSTYPSNVPSIAPSNIPTVLP
jgi:hypothetical protein